MKRTTIAVTGGIGTGKSSVCRLLGAFLDVPVLDLDRMCRELLVPGHAGWKALRELLGTSYFDAQNRLDRAMLRNEIFSNPDLRRTIDAVMHPMVRQELLSRLQLHSAPLFLVDIPLLYEAGWEDDFDIVVVVFACSEVQCQRIMQRDKVTAAQAEASIASQMDLQKKKNMADYLIDNSCSWKSTRMEVIALACRLEE